MRQKKCKTMRALSIIIAAIFLTGLSTAQPVLSISHKTIPDAPTPDNPFLLQITISNSGQEVKDAALIVSEREKDLSIIADGKETSYLTIRLGDVTGSITTTVKLRADREGIYQLKVRLRYNYTESLEEIVPVVVLDEPSLVVEKAISPTLEPGATKTFVFHVLNSGGLAKDVEVQLAAPDGFVVENSRFYFDSWSGGETKAVAFNVSANKDISTGVYSAKLVFNYKDRLGREHAEESSFAISVVGHPEIVLSGFSTTPERIYPDTSFTLSINIENSGKDDAKNVELTLRYPSEFSGETEAYVGTVKRGESSTASFKLRVDRKAESGNYPFTLEVKYLDGEQIKEKSFNFSIFVDSPGVIKLEISGLYFSPRVVTPSESFTLSLQVENAGKQDAKGVGVELLLPEGFEGRTQYFIGTLESGDSATSTFDLIAPPKAGEYVVKAKITYLDSKMERHSVEREFKVYVFPKRSNVAVFVGAAALVLLVGGYVWRRKKR